jgi:hypothetical protein
VIEEDAAGAAGLTRPTARDHVAQVPRPQSPQ